MKIAEEQQKNLFFEVLEFISSNMQATDPLSASTDFWVRSDPEQPLAKRARGASFRMIVMRGFVCYSYDMLQNVWTRLPDLLRDRGYFQAAVLDGEIYAIGTYSLIGIRFPLYFIHCDPQPNSAFNSCWHSREIQLPEEPVDEQRFYAT